LQQVLFLVALCATAAGTALLVKVVLIDTPYTAVAHGMPYAMLQNDVMQALACVACHGAVITDPMHLAALTRAMHGVLLGPSMVRAVHALSSRAAWMAQETTPAAAQAFRAGQVDTLALAAAQDVLGVLGLRSDSLQAQSAHCISEVQLSAAPRMYDALDMRVNSLSVALEAHNACVQGAAPLKELHLRVPQVQLERFGAARDGVWCSALDAWPSIVQGVHGTSGVSSAAAQLWASLRRRVLHTHSGTLRTLHVHGDAACSVTALQELQGGMPLLRELHLSDMCCATVNAVLRSVAAVVKDHGGTQGSSTPAPLRLFMRNIWSDAPTHTGHDPPQGTDGAPQANVHAHGSAAGAHRGESMQATGSAFVRSANLGDAHLVSSSPPARHSLLPLPALHTVYLHTCAPAAYDIVRRCAEAHPGCLSTLHCTLAHTDGVDDVQAAHAYDARPVAGVLRGSAPIPSVLVCTEDAVAPRGTSQLLSAVTSQGHGATHLHIPLVVVPESAEDVHQALGAGASANGLRTATRRATSVDVIISEVPNVPGGAAAEDNLRPSADAALHVVLHVLDRFQDARHPCTPLDALEVTAVRTLMHSTLTRCAHPDVRILSPAEGSQLHRAQSEIDYLEHPGKAMP